MLGEEIKKWRERRGLSMQDLARHAHISREAIGAIERGDRYPNLRTLEAIADCLKITFVIGPTETHIEPE